MVMSVMSGEAKLVEDAVVEGQAGGGLGWGCVWGVWSGGIIIVIVAVSANK